MIDSKALYNHLMDLCNDPASGFFYVDQMYYDGRVYRIFNYRLSSYQYWIKPGALYGRGTVYDVTKTDNPVLVSLCMPKFFNIDENPLAVTSEELDAMTPDRYRVCNKADGSLITLFRNHNGELIVKSKGSLYSDQAIAARKYIEEQSQNIMEFIDANCTLNSSVNMEWVAPDNRIVLRYSEAKLIPLNTVNHITGKVTPFNVDPVELKTIQEMKSRRNIEGVVVYLNDDRMTKVKTDWYVALHRVRDDMSSPKRIAEAVLNEASDDMKAAFPEFKAYIEDIENKVTQNWNKALAALSKMKDFVVHRIDNDYTRKDIAIGAKQYADDLSSQLEIELQGVLFNYAMSIVSGREFCDDKLRAIVIDMSI